MIDRGDVRDMVTRTLIRAAALTALILGVGLAPMGAARAADPQRMPVIQVAASEATSRFIPLGIGKSVAIDLPADIKDVLVADPKIANAVIRSSRRVYMIGVTIGQTNIFFFDADGKQIAGFDIAVTRDLNGVRGALRHALPDAAIRLAGGEFPVGTGTSGPPAYTPSIEFKKFGVSLIFTPVVLSEGRISLKVLTEISELS